MLTKNILLFSEPARTYDRFFLRGVVRYASRQEHWNFYGDMLIHPSYISNIVNKMKFDGIITGESSQQHLDSLTALDLPILIYRAHKTSPREKEMRVVTDHRAIGKMAAQYYTRLGYKNLAYIGSPGSHWNEERLAGFQEELGIYTVHSFKHPAFKTNYDWTRGADLARKWLSQLPKPVAIFAGSDEWGRFALNLCLETELSIPYDVSILGANDDSLICDFCYKPLSSIRLDVEHSGYQAAEQFHRLILGKKAQEKPICVSPLMVIERQSTGCFLSADPHVTRALDFINNNFTNKIHVDHITEAVGTSRRSLETRFKKCTGETLAAAIRRIRAEHACKLLLETDLAVYEIAHQLGYEDEKHFSRYFKNEMGMPPRNYRHHRE